VLAGAGCRKGAVESRCERELWAGLLIFEQRKTEPDRLSDECLGAVCGAFNRRRIQDRVRHDHCAPSEHDGTGATHPQSRLGGVHFELPQFKGEPVQQPLDPSRGENRPPSPQ